MKKVVNKLRRKKQAPAPSRITNDTVAEHRERVLAGGRRYKYPIQYARHKLIINAIIIVVVTVVIMAVVGWWQLYHANNSSTFMYRVTQVLPLPAAKVEGTYVRYSDYLLYLKPSEYYLDKFGDRRSSQDERDYIKRAALDMAIRVSYARNIIKEREIVVTNDEVNSALESLRTASNGQLSEDAVNASVESNFGISRDDVFSHYKNTLSVSKAAFAVDDKALQIKKEVEDKLKASSDLEKVANEINKDDKNRVTFAVSGLVSTASVFSGLKVSEIAKQEDDKVSAAMQSITDDGYFFVKILDRNDTQVSFAYIHVPLTELTSALKTAKDSDKIKEYISVD